MTAAGPGLGQTEESSKRQAQLHSIYVQFVSAPFYAHLQTHIQARLDRIETLKQVCHDQLAWSLLDREETWLRSLANGSFAYDAYLHARRIIEQQHQLAEQRRLAAHRPLSEPAHSDGHP
jgi:hypothetical protein